MILLDTHIVVWLAFHPEKLSTPALSAIETERNERGGLAVSAITLYEIATLAAKRRINVQTSLDSFLGEIENQFVTKPITGRICVEATRLPDHYPKDPVDRLIGATAIVEGLKLITADKAIRESYAVATVW